MTTDPFDNFALKVAEQPDPDAKTVESIRQRLLDAAAADSAIPSPSRPARRGRNWFSARPERLKLSASLAVIVVVVIAIFLVPFPRLLRLGPGSGSTTTSKPIPNIAGGPPEVSVAQLLSGRWSTMAPAPIVPRSDPAIVWTGHELLVWGGSAGSHGSRLYRDGAAYDPSTNRWRLLAPSPLPPTSGASAVWTGQEMLVFGGYDDESLGAFHVTNAAAAYDPSSDTWRLLPPPPLSPRAGAIALWTGKRMIVLGGQPAVTTVVFEGYGDGAAYDPSTDTWSHIVAPVAPRGHKLAWQTAAKVGDELLGFSLWSETRSLGPGSFQLSGGADLFAYDLSTGHWRLIAARSNSMPAPRQALWTGRFLVVRGQPINCGACSHPAEPAVTDIYSPSHNTWTPIPADPLAMTDPGALWTGEALLSFDAGSQFGSIQPGATSLYDPSRRRWRMLTSPPSGCGSDATPIWTNRQVLIYCPPVGSGTTTAAGFVYTPARSRQAVPQRDRSLSRFDPPAAGISRDW
jgi:hypothetical protein